MRIDKRQLSLAALLMVCIALLFWTQSRYPALDQKAHMGQRATISAIAFDTIVKVDVTQPYLERVWRSSLNWGYTNWKGMTFGLLFAAAFITLLHLLPEFPPSRYRALNAIKGMFIGIPLGVCANCSTPIAYGMVSAGTRLETALGTLFSSPTLNIYVLTMTFSLLPFHMALLKLLGVLVFIIIIVPLLVRTLVSNRQVNSKARTSPETLSTLETLNTTPPAASLSTASANTACELPSHSWPEALRRLARSFVIHLFSITKTTLPLMLVAGILGAMAIESIPTSALADLTTSALSLLAVSLIAAFLPVPMTYDVITTTILMASGFPGGLSMALLFGLGIFSIYPAMIIARRISVALSLGLFFAVTLLAITTGAIASYIDKQTVSAATQNVEQWLAEPTLTAAAISNLNEARLVALTKELCGQLSNEQLSDGQLSDAQVQSRCQAHAIEAIQAGDFTINTPDADAAACEAMTDAAAQHACHARVGHDYAISTGDLTYCRVIPVPALQASCNETIIINRIKTQYALETVEKAALQNAPSTHATQSTLKSTAPSIPAAQTAILPGIVWDTVEWTNTDGTASESLTLHRAPYQHSLPDTAAHFTRVSAESVGIKLPFDFRLSDFYEPFKYGRGIASGDVDNNGFPDLVFATSKGPVIFLNKGDGHFSEQALGLNAATPVNTFLVALVDITNDGWQDLFFTTYGGTNYWIENRNGTWLTDALHKIANPNTSLTMSAGFADINQNGSLDAFLGNWTAGAENQFATRYSRNIWWVNNGSDFNAYEDDADTGETLSILLSDFNHNGRVDLVVGNDGNAPDLYYADKPEGGFERILPAQEVIPSTSLTSMSIDTADFNNDLRLDIFTTDMSFGTGEAPSYCALLDDAESTRQCNNLLDGWQSLKALKPQWCQQQPADQQKACVIAFATAIARNTHNPQLCERISADVADIKVLCQRMAESMPITPLSLATHIPQQHSNKLLLGNANGKFQDATESMQVNKSFWSWNSKAADLDNDGWQDILVANGFGFGEQQNEIHSNVFFHNQKGKGFVRATDAFGLNELLNTPTYTYADIDGDGDTDVIATAIMASPRIYINQTRNQSIAFQLRDERGNRFCIGCKVSVFYGDKQQQLKELKLSGGFLSFDDPVALFGLAETQRVDRVVVQWADGSSSELHHPLQTGYRYRITRTSSQPDTVTQ